MSTEVSCTRRSETARLYADHRRTVERAVARRVGGAPAYVIEDVCEFAWLQMLRRPDVSVDERGVSWLVVTAVREGWRHLRRGGS